MNGKEKILEYCNQFTMPDLEHIEHAIENKRMIENGEYRYLNGCPSNYGLEEYKGQCYIEEVEQDEQDNQCELCWKKALQVK
jgi:hypothetical protein